ncbi:hypothetical protein CHLRE_03g161900v5 [Chlamydomonas reinhardtii]|uniref:HNH nuclease domain-containing protein n=1 Tax=Chlamydomonas reinhardtii TaxID=3055 RepID=A0A2K3DWH0_CHLRE|nr:uncharacterized protein CHLRE_03g161900v5 [Chlamydomonas reinhardtii]PNW84873.1 hypothetical protein CHLRE_03g161900v5 [Chlamydomonas reinhardtii]
MMWCQQASAPTIRDALLWANEEDDPTSIQPIIDALCQQGWEVDKQKAGRLFCSLDPFSSAYASLNDRQRTVLKLAIQASAAGLGVGSTGAVAAAGPGQGSTAAGVTLADLHRKVSKMESVLQQHLPFLLSKVLVWRDGSTATHSNSEKDRKTSALKSELQSAGVKGCQLLGEGIPPNCVSLAHLCKLSWADGLGLSKEDVSSPRNALLLSKPIERAYSNSAVCFYEDPADKKLKLHILWDELKSQKLSDCQWLGGPNGNGYAELTNAFGDTTYGDLEARPLQYYSSTVVPFRRVLSAHAQLSLDRAQRDGKMAESWTFQDYRSIENVLTWLQNAELQEPPIANSVSDSSEVMSMGSASAAL